MEISLLLGEQIISLFLIGVVGYAIVKMGLLTAEDSQILSKLCVYIFSPCVIVKSFQIEFTEDKMKGLLLAMAVSVVAHAIFIGSMRLGMKPLDFNRVERASIIYSNSGNLIIPLVSATFGPEWVFYTSAFSMVQTMLVWTHGKSLICRTGEKQSFLKIVTNPNVLAMVFGVIMFAGNIRFPSILDSTISGLGDMIGATSMLVIGMLIGNVDLGWVFRQKRIYFICFFRLIVMPVLCILFIKFTGVAYMVPDGRTIMLIVTLACASSAAAMVTQLAQVFGGDAKYASVINVMSVIFCVITMPLMVLLYETIV